MNIDTIKAEALDFHVMLALDSIAIKFSNTSFKAMSVDKVDKFIKEYNIPKVSPSIYLELLEEAPFEKAKEVIDIFTYNSINKLYLISR